MLFLTFFGNLSARRGRRSPGAQLHQLLAAGVVMMVLVTGWLAA
jgi:hypothetical protein